MHWKFIASVSLLALLYGCATQPSTGTNTISSLDIDFARADGKTYFLLDPSRQAISRAIAQNNKLTFQLPPNRTVGSCVSVVDANGKPLLGEQKFVYLALRDEYQQTLIRRQALASENSSITTTERSTRADLETSTARLRVNRAYAGGSCTRPSQQAIPPRPYVRCGTESECLQDGAAICFSRYLGAQGCGIALNEFKIPGLLSSPGCGAAAAKLAGEKYELGDAIVDALHGLAGDAAKNLMNRGNLGEAFFGAAIAIGSHALQLNDARNCTRSFVERQYAPLRNWLAYAEQIRQEPDQSLGSCQRDAQRLPTLTQQLAVASTKVLALEQSLAGADNTLKRLERERRPIDWCRS